MPTQNFQSRLNLPFLLALLAILVAAVIILLWPSPLAGVTNAGLGTCLKAKGVTMYGVDTCVNCLDQKNLFGADFNNVDYVNCDFQKELCEKKGIRYYPVWAKENQVLIGVQSLQTLAEFGGCELEIKN